MKYVLDKKVSCGIEIALIHWTDNEITPFVVAWNCPFDKIENGIFTGSWGQGHYFMELKNAFEVYNNDYK